MITLFDTGQVYVTYSAAQTFAHHTGAEPEEARRRLTELLLDARRVKRDTSTGAEQWRHRSNTTGLDIGAHVVTEGRLRVVVHLRVRDRPPRRR